MRVLTIGNMYPPHHLGGYEVVWADAVARMRAEGHEVTVLTTQTRFPGVVARDPAYVDRSLPWFWRDHAFVPHTRREARSVARRSRRILDEHLAGRPDLVMWWSMGGMSLGLIERAAAAGVPSLAIVHDAWPAYGPQVDPAADASVLARVDHVSFNSAFVRDAILSRVPAIAAARTTVEHPGIDPERLPAAPECAWGGRLLALGRIDARKGLDVAIRALARTAAGTTLEVVGAGDERVLADLRRLAADLGVAERVRFAGPVDDVGAAYAGADAVLFPVTWDEPFGLVPLEAMSVGRPVVATGTGGSAEYLDDGVNALLVAPGDDRALADAVGRLAGDAALRERLVAAGRRTATEYTAAGFAALVERRAREVAESAPLRTVRVPAHVRARRLLHRAAWAGLGVWWRARRPHTRGVKLVLRDGERVLFVRHSYGDRGLWEIPGGGRRRGETAVRCAEREAAEELGLEGVAWHEVGEIVERRHATAHLTCFVADVGERTPRFDLVELADARWMPAQAPPQPLGPHARQALALVPSRVPH